jgi:CheY-like chemotaxis protein
VGPRTPSLAALCSVKRNLKKPFKAVQLLGALLQLIDEDATTMPHAYSAESNLRAASSSPGQEQTGDGMDGTSGGGGEGGASGSASSDESQSQSQSQSASVSGLHHRRLRQPHSASPASSSSSSCTPGPESFVRSAVPASASEQQQLLQRQQASPGPSGPRSLVRGGGGPSSSSQRGKLVSISGDYPLRILLAEDNLINQKMMVMLLRKLGYEILVAANGREALSLLEEQARRGKDHEIECILMDASMDVMDGMECTRCIRSQQLPHRVRPFIIAQTANVTEEYRVKCLQSGM